MKVVCVLCFFAAGVPAVFAAGLRALSHGAALARGELIAPPFLPASLRKGAKLICRVADQGSGLPLDIWQLTGNRRSVSFGDGLSYESMAQCAGEAPFCQGRDLSEPMLDDVENCPACPCQLDTNRELDKSSDSGATMLDSITQRCQGANQDKPLDVLMLGLGGGTLHTYVRAVCPEATRVRSVEIDQRLATASSRYFGVPLVPGESEVVVDDALNIVRREDAERHSNRTAAFLAVGAPAIGEAGWDIVVVDCFIGGGRMPEHCRNEEFVIHLHQLIKPNGFVMHHMWHTSPKKPEVVGEYKAALGLYKQIFGENQLRVEPVPRADARIRFDDIVVASLPSTSDDA